MRQDELLGENERLTRTIDYRRVFLLIYFPELVSDAQAEPLILLRH
jgi:hypothetical protein